MRNKTILLSFFLFSVTLLRAQLDTSDFRFEVKFIPDQTTIMDTDTLYNHKVLLTLSDTTMVSKISVKIGTSEGMADVGDYGFLFDVDTFLPNGYFYSRESNVVSLIMGRHPAGLYFYEVKLFDENGVATGARKWKNWGL